ncbi:MAG: YoaK family protein [Bacteroidia bacterium]
MLRHFGRRRTFGHNLKLAVLLSATAGIVNVAGFISFSIYTTNVTGHVAGFSKELAESHWSFAGTIALWMLLFLFGAFISNVLIRVVGKKHPRFSHTLPLLIEAFILLFVGYLGEHKADGPAKDHLLSGMLLFAMGMQNAMVTLVSGYVVRTTHLTGLFTDLGIELSSFLFERKKEHVELNKKIILHGSIVLMFISGGIAGGFLYHYIFYRIFIIAAAILFGAIFYDSTRIALYRFTKRIKIKLAK